MKNASNIKMVELKKILFLISLSIHITIQQRPNQEFLHAVLKEFQMKSPHLVSATDINHDFTLAKNIMAKTTQLVKITTKIPDKIVSSSSILLNTIDTKGRRGGAPEGTAMQTSGGSHETIDLHW